jgi:N-acetylmuramoyl-L-alanine amidase CwlA
VSTLNVSATSSCSAPSSAGVHICAPASGSTISSPVQVAATATVTGTIAHTQLWVDGVKRYTSYSGSLTTSVSLSAGSHRFAVVAVNTAGQKWENAVDATVGGTSSCSAPSSAGVHICSPASDSTVASPVKVQAAAKVTGAIAHMQLWIDGVNMFTSASTTLTTSIGVAAGTHRFAVVATNTAGQKWESAVNATVK